MEAEQRSTRAATTAPATNATASRARPAGSTRRPCGGRRPPAAPPLAAEPPKASDAMEGCGAQRVLRREAQGAPTPHWPGKEADAAGTSARLGCWHQPSNRSIQPLQ
ncbi:hypothetical protein PVAP13_2KG372210 [Panicum virgatum]|uniref:Uncharacterized protein n=1 Tax=Panicum virgatum TaxID=38727 RepID=A0A8T0WC72_PANVG|nr:hypothetical protein PVAP13_2KG372210 [Panicum virgatum]